MNPHLLETNYVSLRSALRARAQTLIGLQPEIGGFWERWCAEHQMIARRMSAGDSGSGSEVDLQKHWLDFLKLRQRMISALVQGIKTAKSRDEQRLREELTLLLRDHDQGFVALLQGELERVREHMTIAFTVRKTVNAYAQTVQFRGE